MTARAEAAGVFHDRERLRVVGLRRPLGDLADGLELHPGRVPEARRIVTLYARDLVVLGHLPAIDVGAIMWQELQN